MAEEEKDGEKEVPLADGEAVEGEALEEQEEAVVEKPPMPEWKLALIAAIVAIIAAVVVGYIIGAGREPRTISFLELAREERGPEKAKAQLGFLIIEPKKPLMANLQDSPEIRGEYMAILHDVRLLGDKAKYPTLDMELFNRKFQLRDIFHNVLITKTEKELGSKVGKEAFKEEMVEKINAILQDGQIDDIYVQLIVELRKEAED
ncbi:MAG: flagellar basal body-associated FliL family protein [bacterium]